MSTALQKGDRVVQIRRSRGVIQSVIQIDQHDREGTVEAIDRVLRKALIKWDVFGQSSLTWISLDTEGKRWKRAQSAARMASTEAKFMFKITCFTNLDEFKREEWPRELPAVPLVGQGIAAKSRKRLTVVAVNWQYDGTLEVELHK